MCRVQLQSRVKVQHQSTWLRIWCGGFVGWGWPGVAQRWESVGRWAGGQAWGTRPSRRNNIMCTTRTCKTRSRQINRDRNGCEQCDGIVVLMSCRLVTEEKIVEQNENTSINAMVNEWSRQKEPRDYRLLVPSLLSLCPFWNDGHTHRLTGAGTGTEGRRGCWLDVS